MVNRSEQGNRISTVLGRRLGGQLLLLRDAAGKTQQEAAQVLSATATKIVKMERGWVPVREPDIRALCTFYGQDDPKAVDALLGLAKLDRERRKAKGWWNEYPALRDMVECVALEDVASSVRTWQQSVVPGILQTADYARAVAMGNGMWDDPAEVEPFVESRMARQGRLVGEAPLQLRAVVHESALRQLVGDRSVMRAQLGHLLEQAERPNIRLQVLPSSAGAHPGMNCSFSIVTFDGPGAVDVVHMDTSSANVWLESEADAMYHRAIFDRITRLGLAQHNSAALIAGFLKEM
ncbi:MULTISPECIES: helix-turn-helix domain-containing protein [Streptomyces]|uniref:helix-turn-helix domain-containing protein n=1 Tax=Streptomyces TaxID=1883 RepID=UPI0004C05F9B|nr:MULTISPECIES: helix-turn-helix transcriptional regulator [Streptomyces]KOT54333.1 DNA-binding protein [Streptomyces rimosus subsp. rimosus]